MKTDMDTRKFTRSLGLAAGAAAVIALGGLTAACGNTSKESPSTTTSVTTTTTTTTSATPAPSEAPAPTQKSIDPTGGNLFTPSVVAPPAPTVPGGQHPGINGIS